MEIIEKVKEYCSFVRGSWFTVEVMEYGNILLKYYYPGIETKSVKVFDNLEDFLESDCLEILKEGNFIQVKDK